MRIPFTLLLLAGIFAEIAVFILVGQAVGVLPTLALALLSMIVGVALLRQQGLATALGVRAELAAGRLPARPLVEGAVIALAAFLMILPGFITDAVGLILFVPRVRHALGRRIGRRLAARAATREPLRPARGAVVELHRDDYAAAPRPDSPWRGDDGRQA